MIMNEEKTKVVDSELFSKICYQTGIVDKTEINTCRNFYWNLIEELKKGSVKELIEFLSDTDPRL